MATAKPMKTPVMPKGPMRGRGMPVPKGAIKKGTLSRLLKTLMKHYTGQTSPHSRQMWHLIIFKFATNLPHLST